MRFPSRRNGRRRSFRQIEQFENRRLLAAVMTVNTTADNNIRDNFLTLRESILVSNRTLSPLTLTTAEQAQVNGTPLATETNTIRFNIPANDPGHVYYRNNGIAGSVSIANITTTTASNDATIADIDPDWAHSWWRIQPTSFLGNITSNVVINGYTQPGASANTNGELLGSNAVLRIGLNGSLAGATGALGNVTAAQGLGSIGIKGLVIDDWQFQGIYISAVKGEHSISGNFIGVDVSGTLDRGNGGAGIWLASNNSVIGGVTPADRNIISGTNNGVGISLLSQTWTGNNSVKGNFIGLGRDGVTSIGNSTSGIDVADVNTTIGGTTPGARNVISGNGFKGMQLSFAALDVVVQGNYIGTDVTGSLDRGNGSDGVSFDQFQFAPSRGTIGGTANGAGNLISGNGGNGILFGRVTDSATVQGNFLGTNRTGTQAIPNSQFGIAIVGIPSINHQIGGTTAGAGNLISGNALGGIYIATSGAGGHQIQGNRIGTDVAGSSPLGNGFDGILIESTTINNVIGGTVTGAGNTIAFNARNGVALKQSTTTRQSILGNSIHGNGALGIDLSGGNTIPDGVTPNDLGDPDTTVANLGQNYPVLASAATAGSVTTINGTLNSTASATFRVEFFASASADASGFGEGQTYLGFATVTTDSSGNASFSFNTTSPVPAGQFITSTATDSNGNTSEFSAVRAVTSSNTTNRVTGTAGNDAFVLNYSSTSTTGNVTVTRSTNGGASVNLGTFPMNVSLTVDGLGGTDSVRVEGTSGIDTYLVTSANVRVNGAILLLRNLESRTLAGLSGGDFYRFDADAALGAFTLQESAAGIDEIDFSPTTTLAVAMNLGLTTTQVVNSNLSLSLSSVTGFENLKGGSLNDVLTGNTLNNILTGLAGNDAINGGRGNDSHIGGTGDDTYIFGNAATSEIDTVTELANQGADTLNFSNVTTAITASLGLTSAQAIHLNRTLTLNSGAVIENIIGGSGNDILTGNSLANVLVGNAGNDRLRGIAGRDLLIGGQGLDNIDGGADDDILIAGVTTHDTNPGRLNIVLADWNSPGTYTQRVTRLRAGVGSPAVFLKAGINVTNDAGEDDRLTGSTGEDWFFRATDDVITDLFAGELLDLL